jgi:Uma2 family endonuclease
MGMSSMKTAVRKPKPKPRLAEDLPLPLVLRTRPVFEIDDDQLLALSSLNGDLQLERSAEGDLVIMTPVGWRSSDRNAQITRQLGNWADADGTGVVTDSSGGYRLPNSAVRAPDAAWILRSRLEEISTEQKEKFLPLCPDFVIELRSPSDRLAVAQAKMREYVANGARLGWLIDPLTRRVYVYRPDARVERLDNPERVAGDPVLPGFVLDLREIW